MMMCKVSSKSKEIMYRKRCNCDQKIAKRQLGESRWPPQPATPMPSPPYCNEFIEFINYSTTAYHAVNYSKIKLNGAGYYELHESEVRNSYLNIHNSSTPGQDS